MIYFPPSYISHSQPKAFTREVAINGDEGIECAVDGMEIRRAFPCLWPNQSHNPNVYSFLCGYPIEGEGSSTPARMRDILAFLRREIMPEWRQRCEAIKRGGFRRLWDGQVPYCQPSPEFQLNQIGEECGFFWGYRDGETHVLSGRPFISRSSILVGALIEVEGNSYVQALAAYEAVLWHVNDYLERWQDGLDLYEWLPAL